MYRWRKYGTPSNHPGTSPEFREERPQMTGHHESTGPDPALSSDSVRRVSQYQTAGVNARLRLFALLEAQGVPASEADDLVAGAVAGAQCQVVELDGMAPRPRGAEFENGWDKGVVAVSEALVGI